MTSRSFATQCALPSRWPRRRWSVPLLAGLMALWASSAVRAGEPAIGQLSPPSRYIWIPLAAPADTTRLAEFSFDGASGCDAMGWQSVDRTVGFGDFAGLFSGPSILQDDPCRTEMSCLWGFFEQSAFDYACGGAPTQAAVPMGGGGLYIHNEIWSPLIPVSGQGSTFLLRFDVYRDLALENLVFYGWRIRSDAAGVPGPWRDADIVYYGAGKDWLRVTESVGALIDPGASGVQIALVTRDLCGMWCGTLGDGACHSHSPLFDNVRLLRVDDVGPTWRVRHVDLFQDNFASDGTTTGTVRADAALDILPRPHPGILPGDSVCVTVSAADGLDDHAPGDPGSGPAVYTYVAVWPRGQAGKHGPDIEAPETALGKQRFPLTDSIQHDGVWWYCFRMDSCRTGGVLEPNRFCFDLRDDVFTPGDTVCYFFGARDGAGASTYWSRRWNGQAQGFVTTGLFEAMASPLEFTCLPAGGWRRGGDILYVDDADDDAAVQRSFEEGFDLLGIAQQVDRYDVLAPTSLANNGPASRVGDVDAQVTGPYSKIIWSSGNRADGVIGDGSGRPLKVDDFTLLFRFLDEPSKNTGVYLTGDNIASNWDARTGSAQALRSTYMNFLLVGSSHTRGAGDDINPLLRGTASLFSHGGRADSFIVYGGCPVINDFDVLEAAGTAVVEMRSAAGYGYVVRQSTLNPTGAVARVILSGFSYHEIRDPDPAFPPAPVEHLKDALTGIMDYPCPVPVGTCQPGELRAQAVAKTVQLQWTLNECMLPLLGLHIYKETGDSGEQRVATLPPTAVDFVDTEIESRTRYTYTLGVVVDDQVPCPEPGVLKYSFGTVWSNPFTINRLDQNFPNPFRPTTAIEYSLETDAHVILRVYDAQGRLVRTLVDKHQPAIDEGYHVDWDGTNSAGRHVSSGVYFYKITADNFVKTRKMILLR